MAVMLVVRMVVLMAEMMDHKKVVKMAGMMVF
jgi:hypothetical protein